MREIIAPDVLAVFEKSPGGLALYAALAERILALFEDADIRAARTQVSFFVGHMFACASLAPVRRKAERPEPFLTVTFGLPGRVDSPRLIAVRTRPGRWTHHAVIGSAEEIDGELTAWLREAHDFANRKTTGLRSPRAHTITEREEHHA